MVRNPLNRYEGGPGSSLVLSRLTWHGSVIPKSITSAISDLSWTVLGLLLFLWKVVISNTGDLWLLVWNFPYQASSFATNWWGDPRDAILSLWASVAQFLRKKMSYCSRVLSAVSPQISIVSKEPHEAGPKPILFHWAQEHSPPHSLSSITGASSLLASLGHT